METSMSWLWQCEHINDKLTVTSSVSMLHYEEEIKSGSPWDNLKESGHT